MTKKKKATNPNANCLEGWKCPKCNSFGDFNIFVGVMCRMSDEGTEEYYGDTEYDNSSYAQCVACGHEGTVGAFQE